MAKHLHLTCAMAGLSLLALSSCSVANLPRSFSLLTTAIFIIWTRIGRLWLTGKSPEETLCSGSTQTRDCGVQTGLSFLTLRILQPSLSSYQICSQFRRSPHKARLGSHLQLQIRQTRSLVGLLGPLKRKQHRRSPLKTHHIWAPQLLQLQIGQRPTSKVFSMGPLFSSLLRSQPLQCLQHRRSPLKRIDQGRSPLKGLHHRSSPLIRLDQD